MTLLTVTVVPVVTVALLSGKAGAVMVVVVAVVRVGEVFLHEALMSFEFGRLGFCDDVDGDRVEHDALENFENRSTKSTV